MANISNPRKKFNFTISIPTAPIDPFLVQNVEIPEREIEVVEHGDTNHDIKTGGRVKIGMITLEKISTTTGADVYFEDWMLLVQNEVIGGGSAPAIYKKLIIITELAEDGTTQINQWTAIGCWPSKRNSISLDRTESDNTIESVELCVDKLVKL
tara:strand:- start:3518 stop:3979 length:462 start_codon:yes stop_codon:yes gene_type:complete